MIEYGDAFNFLDADFVCVSEVPFWCQPHENTQDIDMKRCWENAWTQYVP